jgi:hypothetical protein
MGGRMNREQILVIVEKEKVGWYMGCRCELNQNFTPRGLC